MKALFKFLEMLLVVVVTSNPLFASDFESDGIQYTITSLSELTLSVDGVNNKDTVSLIIPAEVSYKGKLLEVTSIRTAAFATMQKLKEVKLPLTLTSIGDRAFQNDSLLVNFSIPNSVTSIGYAAFEGCVSLTDIKLPPSVKELSSSVFKGCSRLINISGIENIKTIEEYSLFGTGITSINLSSVEFIGKYALAYSALTGLDWTSSQIYIPEGCFMGCNGLIYANIPEHVQTISEKAFKNSSIQEFNLSEGLRYISSEAISSCSKLSSFIIPNSVSTIAPDILWGCDNLKLLSIGTGLSSMPAKRESNPGKHPWAKYYFLQSYTSYYEDNWGNYGIQESESYLQNLSKVIIRDSSELFGIRGYDDGGTVVPSFYKVDSLYIGRPLNEIKKFSIISGLTIDIELKQQGSGRINTLEVGGECTEVPFFYQAVDTLILGNRISSFLVENIYPNQIKKIISKASIPPDCNEYSKFPTSVYTDAVLCVPRGKKEIYSSSEFWKNFWNIEEFEDSDSGIGSIIVDSSKNSPIDIYGINGILIKSKCCKDDLQALPRGIYIIRQDGQSKKIEI